MVGASRWAGKIQWLQAEAGRDNGPLSAHPGLAARCADPIARKIAGNAIEQRPGGFDRMPRDDAAAELPAILSERTLQTEIEQVHNHIAPSKAGTICMVVLSHPCGETASTGVATNAIAATAHSEVPESRI